MLTEWDAAVSAILDLPEEDKGVKQLLQMCGDENEEVKHRGLVCVGNVVGAPGATGQRGIEKVKSVGGVALLQEALKGAKGREVMAAGVEVLKKVM